MFIFFVKQNIIKNKPYVEFPYLEELTNFQIENLKKVNWTVNDPGKRFLLYMKNKFEETLELDQKNELLIGSLLPVNKKIRKKLARGFDSFSKHCVLSQPSLKPAILIVR